MAPPKPCTVDTANPSGTNHLSTASFEKNQGSAGHSLFLYIVGEVEVSKGSGKPLYSVFAYDAHGYLVQFKVWAAGTWLEARESPPRTSE